LDGWAHNDTEGAISEALQLTGRHTDDRIPQVGGGLARATVEAFVANYDYHRDRELTPNYMKDEPKKFQYTPYTLETSKAIGELTGDMFGVSPIQLEHLLNSASGGGYRRLVGALEATYEGNLKWENAPVVGGTIINRHQARSLDDFYTEYERVKLEHRTAERTGDKVSPELTRTKERLDDYADLMTEIRALDPKDFKGRRSFKYEPYLVGLAREALKRDPLDSNQSPFAAKDLPKEIATILRNYAKQKALLAYFDYGEPKKRRKGDKSFSETYSRWKSQRSSARSWIDSHRKSKPVQDGILEAEAQAKKSSKA
jgi:hypothetical protein